MITAERAIDIIKITENLNKDHWDAHLRQQMTKSEISDLNQLEYLYGTSSTYVILSNIIWNS